MITRHDLGLEVSGGPARLLRASRQGVEIPIKQSSKIWLWKLDDPLRRRDSFKTSHQGKDGEATVVDLFLNSNRLESINGCHQSRQSQEELGGLREDAGGYAEHELC